MVLYTDGIYEVNNSREEEFGQERLIHSIRENIRLPAEALFDALLREVQEFSGTTEFDDDVCLVGTEVHRLIQQPQTTGEVRGESSMGS